MNDINDPLENIKVASALRSENMKLEYRKVNKPKEINILDYTVIAALEKQIPKDVNSKCDEDWEYYYCGNCNVNVDEDNNYCVNCGQKLDWN